MYTSQVDNQDVVRYLTIGGKPNESGNSWAIKDSTDVGGNQVHNHTTNATNNLPTGSYKLTMNDLPEYNHSIPDHNHGGTTNNDGQHKHVIEMYNWGNDGGSGNHSSDWCLTKDKKADGGVNRAYVHTSTSTDEKGQHSHSFTTNNKTGLSTNNTCKSDSTRNSHTHSFNIPSIDTTNSKVNSSVLTQEQPLYLLIYVYMRVSNN